jgi:membrane protease YdiL (CAAX protease family)
MLGALFYWLFVAFLFAFPFFWLRAAKSYSWDNVISELLPRPQGWKKELVGTLKLFFLMLGMFILLNVALNLLGINDLSKVDSAIGEEIAGGLLPFLFSMAIIVLVEEIFFRSFLVNRIGAFPSTLIFTSAHIGYGSIAELVGVFFLGFLIAYWFRKNNSIIQTYFAHLIYNLLAVLLYLMI